MSMIVSDFDGTYSTSLEDIKINSKMLKNYISHGNYFVLSSGRSFTSLKGQVDTYNIPYSFLASCDGNYLFDKNDNVIMRNTIDEKIVSKIENLKKIRIYDKIDYAYDKIYSEYYIPYEKLGTISIKVRDRFLNDEFLNEFNRLKEENKDYTFVVYTYHNTSFYMIRPLGVNKTTPIKFLERKLKLDGNDIYTIGDNTNDLDMIRDYNGFIIGNNKEVMSYALKKYDAVHSLISDVKKKKVLKRW